MTYEELQARIAELEKAGLYNTHINPVNEDNVIKVDEHYPYIHKPFFKAIGYFFTRLFIVKPFSFYKNHFEFHTKYVGRENLKGIHGAIVTSNHVDIFDCLANFKVLHGHKVRTIAAPFNNFKGFLGTTMRAQNMLPLSNELKGMKEFLKAVKYTLEKGDMILIYPEQAMWWHYTKPRPNKEGAFNFAVKYNVPVVPMFNIIKPTGKYYKNGYPKHQFTIHICKPIYPRNDLSPKENEAYLLQENEKAWKEIYSKYF